MTNFGIDFAQSNSIFTFGGFYGFSIAIIKYIRSKFAKLTQEDSSSRNRYYQANLNSVSFSLIGLGILVAFFPILAAHPTYK